MGGRLSQLEIDGATEAKVSVNEESDTDNEDGDETESQYNGIMVTSTAEFKAALKAAATKADKSLSAFVRDILAETISYDGPMSKATKRVRKYASEEERAAAQKARNAKRRDVIKDLLEKYGDEFKAKLAEDEEED